MVVRKFRGDLENVSKKGIQFIVAIKEQLHFKHSFNFYRR